MSQYLDFVDLKYNPSKTDLVCLFRFESARGISTRECIGRIASESSNGTWSDLSTLKPHIRKIRARAFEIKGNYVKIAYPIELFELGSVPQLLSSFAGNIFGMKAVNNLRLEDVHFPKILIKSFRGPQYGIDGIRRLFRVEKRPLTASVPKPKVGMTADEHCKVADEIWRGGVDFLKDDENLTNQKFNRFDTRARRCFKIRDRVEMEIGERKGYFINVTAETNEMLRRAKLVRDLGGEYVMIDVLTAGFSGFQTLREFCHDYKMAIHIHRAMHATMTRNPRHGISMLSLAKFVRLVGGDSLHIGTVIGKLAGKKDEVLMLEHEIEHEIEPCFKTKEHVLNQNWHDIKPMFAVSSGGLHPGLVPQVMHMLGNNIVLQLGGGIHGHPLGSKSGAIALRHAVDSVMHDIPLIEYAKKSSELSMALEKWGYNRPK
nr:RuBisCO long chain, Form III-b [uncultured archaeon]